MKWIIIAILLSTFSAFAADKYEWRMWDYGGVKVSECFEVTKTQKAEPQFAEKEKCEPLKPKTELALIKAFNTTMCFEVDSETKGQKFKAATNLKMCDAIRPKTKHYWVMVNGESHCEEQDIETRGLKFNLARHYYECKAKKPATHYYLTVIDKHTRCSEVDNETNGKNFKISEVYFYNECAHLKPKTIYAAFSMPSDNGKKYCYEVDEETRGKKFIQRCLDIDPNPLVRQVVKEASEMNEPPSVYQSMIRKYFPILDSSNSSEKAAQGKQK